jgi:glutamate formiminotransferase / 5-formyltetrahydrofolate cyclo-ligase
VLECVVNVSEGRRPAVLDALAHAAGADLLDLHVDPDHHRSVWTLVGEDAPRRLATAAVATIDLRRHQGAHPRLGAVDVVPFVSLGDAGPAAAAAARDRFASWAGAALRLPAFTYGPGGPSLPDVRRRVRRMSPEVRRRVRPTLRPVSGLARAHPTAGAVAVGARPVLVAYNVWLAEADLTLARSVAAGLRSPAVRALGLAVGSGVQVSCNLVDPAAVGPAQVVDAVAARARVRRTELVGLVPAAVVEATDPRRWAELGLSPERTIEHRLARRRGGAGRP